MTPLVVRRTIRATPTVLFAACLVGVTAPIGPHPKTARADPVPVTYGDWSGTVIREATLTDRSRTRREVRVHDFPCRTVGS